MILQRRTFLRSLMPLAALPALAARGSTVKIVEFDKDGRKVGVKEVEKVKKDRRGMAQAAHT